MNNNQHYWIMELNGELQMYTASTTLDKAKEVFYETYPEVDPDDERVTHTLIKVIKVE